MGAVERGRELDLVGRERPLRALQHDRAERSMLGPQDRHREEDWKAIFVEHVEPPKLVVARSANDADGLLLLDREPGEPFAHAQADTSLRLGHEADVRAEDEAFPVAFEQIERHDLRGKNGREPRRHAVEERGERHLPADERDELENMIERALARRRDRPRSRGLHG